MESDADLVVAMTTAGGTFLRCSDCQIDPMKSGIAARWRANPGQSLQRLPSLAPEIKNRCTLECVSGENLAVILKSGPEIKNRCTQEVVNGHNLAAIAKFTP